MSKHFRTALLLACVLAPLGCSAPKPDGCSSCNVVLLSIDTLRADHLGLYGHARPTSPTLDELSHEAVVFDNFFNNGGSTLPVHMSMMTSLQPYTHNVLPGSNRRLADERVTLAEVLSERGWNTAAFTDGGWVLGSFGFDQGFATFDDSGGRLATILPKALDWLSENGSSPFFLFLHTYDVHSEWTELPYECPDEAHFTFLDPDHLTYEGCSDGLCASQRLLELDSRLWAEPQLRRELLEAGVDDQLARLYDGCIRYVDGKVAELVDHLRRAGVYDDTMIIVTSDHGEAFLEHRALLHNSLFEEVVRIPLVIKLPESRHAGRRVDHLGTTIDLAPTVLDVLGVNGPEEFRGHSLMTTVVDDAPIRESFTLFDSIRTTRWKYLDLGEMQLLYDLVSDPLEQNNLAGSHPQRLIALRELAHGMAEEERRAGADFEARVGQAEEITLDEDARRELRALGYVQ